MLTGKIILSYLKKVQERIDNYFLSLPEPHRSCLLFLRDSILGYSHKITEKRSFNTPFYSYQGKSLGFISYDPKTGVIYFSFTRGFLLDHSALASDGRKKQKVLYIDPAQDIDIKNLKEILDLACKLY